MHRVTRGPGGWRGALGVSFWPPASLCSAGVRRRALPWPQARGSPPGPRKSPGSGTGHAGSAAGASAHRLPFRAPWNPAPAPAPRAGGRERARGNGAQKGTDLHEAAAASASRSPRAPSPAKAPGPGEARPRTSGDEAPTRKGEDRALPGGRSPRTWEGYNARSSAPDVHHSSTHAK